MTVPGAPSDTRKMAKINLMRQLILALMIYSAATAKEHLRIRRLAAAESVTEALPNASQVTASEESTEAQTEVPSQEETKATEMNKTEIVAKSPVPAENVETRNSAFDLPANSDQSSSLGSEEDSIYYDNAPVECQPELVGFEIVTG